MPRISISVSDELCAKIDEIRQDVGSSMTRSSVVVLAVASYIRNWESPTHRNEARAAKHKDRQSKAVGTWIGGWPRGVLCPLTGCGRSDHNPLDHHEECNVVVRREIRRAFLARQLPDPWPHDGAV